jgi:pentatricopeptide repeat protein
MQQQGIEPNPCTMVFALKACTMGASEQEKEKKKEKKGEEEEEEKPMAAEIIGRALHGDCLARGLFPANRFIATQLINMYSGFGDLQQAEEAFVRCSRRDGIAWNAMLLAHIEHKFARRALLLYRQMQEEEGAELDHVSFAGACQACAILAESERVEEEEEEEEEEEAKLAKSRALEIGFSVYSDARRQGRGRWVAPSLIALCSKFGAMSEATHVFVSTPHQDAVMWSSLVSAFVDDGRKTEALRLFRHMQAQGVVPSRHSFVCALKACGGGGGKSSSSSIGGSGEEDGGSASSAASLEICRALHADIAKRSELALDPLLATTLLAVYARCCSSADEADAIFLASPRPGGIVPWNATIAACVDRGDAEKALRLYRDMVRIEPGWVCDRRTMELAIRACGMLRRSCRSEIADALHADAIQGGHASDSAFASILATMHYRCGFAQKARAALSALPAPARPDAWNAFLLTATRNDENRPGKMVLELYCEMSNRGVAIGQSSLIAILRSCAESRSLDMCRGVHFGVVSGGCETAPQVAAGLMRAYGQCASALESWLVLEEFEEPDIVLWTAGIQGYAAEGNASSSLRVYEGLKLSGACPDPVSFSCVLLACAHDGLVPECLGYFEEMTTSVYRQTVPGLTHYGLLVDGLGRAGDFRRLESLWRSLPMPADMTMYVSLLAACRTHGNHLALAEMAFDQALNLVELEPEVNSSTYVLMSNMYTNAGFQSCVSGPGE